jgi:hypothetical protein
MAFSATTGRFFLVPIDDVSESASKNNLLVDTSSEPFSPEKSEDGVAGGADTEEEEWTDGPTTRLRVI